jgi:acetyl-CoA C-acetyltransferase
MLTGPAPAARKALAKAGLEVDDIDLFEINEAFAAVAMRFMRDLGLTPRARIVSVAVSGADPTIMLTGPAPAARKALAKAGLEVSDIDLWEMNEAFAAVAMCFMKDMGITHEVTNVNGGAIAMGHPLGATGAMILGTLIDELHRRDQRRGLATLCVGGGMGIATVVEVV